MNTEEIQKIVKDTMAAEKRRQFKKKIILILVIGFFAPVFLYAASIAIPNSFSDGETLSASKLNENFVTLQNKVNELVAKQSPIRQVVSATKTDVLNTTVVVFTDVPGLSVTITPKGTNSKFLIVVNLNCGMSNSTAGHFRIVRDSTSIADGDPAGVNRISGTGGNCYTPTDQNSMQSMGMNFYDSPAGSGPFTYKIQVRTQDGTGNLRLNTSGSDVDAAFSQRSVSSITVIEVDGTSA